MVCIWALRLAVSIKYKLSSYESFLPKHWDHRKSSSHGRMHYGIWVIQTTANLLLKDERILYHWCENISSHSPKPKSFDVCQHHQNQSRSPKIRQQSQWTTPPTLFPHLNQQEYDAGLIFVPLGKLWRGMKKMLSVQNNETFHDTSLSAKWKNHIIFKRGFKCLPASLLATSSCTGNINWETVIRPSA